MLGLNRYELNHYQYLFLGGIIGEVLSLPFVGNYLKSNEKILRDLGVNDITTMTLNSYHSAEKNAEVLAKILSDLYEKNNKKIVLFAHSKAALEAVLCFKNNLELFKSNVFKVVLVQPPFKGSSLLGNKRTQVTKHIWPGLHCLSRDFYSESIEGIFQDDSEHAKYSKDSIMVVKGTKNKTKNVSWILKSTHTLYHLNNQTSDGLLDLKSQSLENENHLKTITLDIDHSDVFCSGNLSKMSDGERTDLFLSICEWAINSDNTSLRKWQGREVANGQVFRYEFR